MEKRRPKKEDWDTMLASLEAAFLAAGIPMPLKLAGSVVAMIKRHWTNDGRLEPEYEREKALQLVEEAIEPLAGAHLEHAADLDQLKQGQDQIVMLILRVLREIEAGGGEHVDVALFEGPRCAPAKPVPFFHGRDDELAELEQLLLDNRTVCVVATGIGGIGKSTLAEEFVATRAPELFPDGVAWLDGRELITELGRVARRFGWGVEREATPSEALSLLGQRLHTQRLLLVVDNFEPTIGDPEHVPRPGGQCRTVVTSRSRPLAGRLGAAPLELGVWDVDACREYLRERCPRLRSEADAEVDRLAEFVGRLPLGVRLLVSVLDNRRSLAAVEVLDLLEQQPLGMLDKYEADRGVAATFQASYEVLTDVGRRILQALAVCAKQTRAEVVAAMARVDDASEILDDLHVRGLAEFAVEEGAAAPWGLHDVVRMFLLSQRGSEDFELQHLDWVRRHLREYADATARPAFAHWVNEARQAYNRLLNRDVEAAAATIYAPLVNYLRVVGRYSEVIELSQSLLAAAPSNTREASTAMHNLGMSYAILGDIPTAIECHQRSLAIDEKLGLLENQAGDLGGLGICYKALGDISKAMEYHNRALAIHEKLESLEGQACDLGNLGVCYLRLDDIPKAIDHFERSLVIDEKLGLLVNYAKGLGNLGMCYLRLDDLDKAVEHLEHALAIDRKLGHSLDEAINLEALATCYLTLGDTDKFFKYLEHAIVINGKLGRTEGQAVTLSISGIVAGTHGAHEHACDFLTDALEFFRLMGLPQDHPKVSAVRKALASLKQ